MSVHCAIIVACDDPEAFRPLSYSLAPCLLPVRGVPALERLLSAIRDLGASRVAVFADHRFHAIQAHLQVLGEQDGAPEITLAHADQLAAAPARLGTSGDRVLVCAWNALWLDDPGEVLEASGAPLTAISVAPEDSARPSLSALATDLASLQIAMQALIAPESDLPPTEWLGEMVRGAESRGLSVERRERITNRVLLDGLASYQRMAAGWLEDARADERRRAVVFIDTSARIAAGASLLGPSVLGAHAALEPDASIEDAILLSGNRIGRGTRLKAVLLGPADHLPAHARLANACLHHGEVLALRSANQDLPIIMRGRPKRGQHKGLDAARRRPRANGRAAEPHSGGIAAEDVTRHAGRLLGRMDVYGEPIRRTASFLSSGFQNKVCRVKSAEDDVIVKWALKGEPAPLWVEHHCMRVLAGSDIAPRTYFLDLRRDPFPFPVLMCEALKGREMRSSHLDAPMLERIGRLLRRVHEVDGDGIWEAMPHFPSYGFADLRDYVADTVDMFRYYARYRRDVGLPDDSLMGSLYSCVERLLQYVEQSVATWDSWGSASWPLKLCHGDLVPHNFMWDEATGRLALIDWERAGVGDPAYELAWFMALNQLAGASESSFLRGYLGGEVTAGDSVSDPASAPALLSRITAYRRVTALSWPIQILAYQARYWRERFPVTMDPAEYVTFNLREAYRRLADGLTHLGTDLGGWRATAKQLEDMGRLLVMP